MISRIEHRIGSDVENIIHGDHRMIFIEAMTEGATVGVLRPELIMRLEDKDLPFVIKKYFKYGLTARLASRYYPEKLRARFRDVRVCAIYGVTCPLRVLACICLKKTTPGFFENHGEHQGAACAISSTITSAFE